MSWAATASAAATVGMGMLNKGSSGPSLNDMNRIWQGAANKTGKDYAPWLEGGQQAQKAYLSQLGIGGPPTFDVSQLPGYQNAMQQGISAVNQGFAGSGLLGGNRLRALQQTGQNVFGSYYQDYMNRLSGASQQGFGAASNLGNLRAGQAAQMSNYAYDVGMNKANAQNAQMYGLTGALGSAAGAWMGRPSSVGVPSADSSGLMSTSPMGAAPGVSSGDFIGRYLNTGLDTGGP